MFHVENFRDPTLHNEEVGVVDVETDGLEERLYDLLLRSRTVDEVFAGATHDDLAGDGDLGEALVVHGGFGLVGIVEYDGDASFRDTGLSALVDEVLM